METVTFCEDCRKEFIGKDIDVYTVSPLIKVCDICGNYGDRFTGLKTFSRNLKINFLDFKLPMIA